MNNSEPINEELLSAYLDGELSETESLRVEKQVAEDDSLRATLSELEKIRDEIRQLPRHTLSSDFAAKITQSIEQQQPKTPPLTVQRTTKSTSRLAGILATIAALLFISIWGIRYLPQSQNTAMNDATQLEGRADSVEMKQANSEFSAAPAGQITESADDIAVERRFFESSEAAPSKAVRSMVLTRTASYDLVLDYDADAQNLDLVSTKYWQSLAKSQQPANNDANVTEYVIEGTPEEIRTALVSLRSVPTKQLAETQLGVEYEDAFFRKKKKRFEFAEQLKIESPSEDRLAAAADEKTDAMVEESVAASVPETELYDLKQGTRDLASPAAAAPTQARFAVPTTAADSDAEETESVDAETKSEPIRMRVLVRFRNK